MTDSPRSGCTGVGRLTRLFDTNPVDSLPPSFSLTAPALPETESPVFPPVTLFSRSGKSHSSSLCLYTTPCLCYDGPDPFGPGRRPFYVEVSCPKCGSRSDRCHDTSGLLYPLWFVRKTVGGRCLPRTDTLSCSCHSPLRPGPSPPSALLSLPSLAVEHRQGDTLLVPTLLPPVPPSVLRHPSPLSGLWLSDL